MQELIDFLTQLERSARTADIFEWGHDDCVLLAATADILQVLKDEGRTPDEFDLTIQL